jgi:hypothetical protein
MLKQLIALISFAAILFSGCTSPPSPFDRASFAELCQALGKKDGKISKEELLAAVDLKDKEKAAKLFDQCQLSPEGVLTVEERRRENWPIRELIRLTPPPRVVPPPCK